MKRYRLPLLLLLSLTAPAFGVTINATSGGSTTAGPLYVDHNGTLTAYGTSATSDAERGTALLAAVTAANTLATNNASDNVVVKMSAACYDLGSTNTLKLHSHVSLVGLGKRITTVKGTAVRTYGAIINPGTSSSISGFTLDTSAAGAGSLCCPIGAALYETGVQDHDFQNVKVDGVEFISPDDSYHLFTNNPGHTLTTVGMTFEIAFTNCSFSGNWDHVSYGISSAPGATITTLISDFTMYTNGTHGRAVNIGVATGSTITTTLRNGHITTLGGDSFNRAVNIGAGSEATTNIKQVTFSTTGVSPIDIYDASAGAVNNVTGGAGSDTGGAYLTTGSVNFKNGPIPGTLSGVLKANGSGVVSAAAAGTDYLAPAAIGVTVQAYDADLTTYAGITPSANVQTMLASANNAAILSNIGAFASTSIDTSSELATLVTDETGSGALVFGTSPTLTTPLLGTPQSGSLGSCTGYTVGNLSGLGTGVGTFLATPTSANLAAAITNETGSGLAVFGTDPTFSNSITLGTSGILVGGTNLVEQRNGTNAQTYELYATYSSAGSNYERLKFTFNGASYTIVPENAGTGVNSRNLVLGPGDAGSLFFGGGTNYWKIPGMSASGAGTFMAVTDNANDFGDATHRAKTIYAGTSIAVGSSPTAFTRTLSTTATLDFSSTNAQTSSELTITLTGAAVGDAVFVGPPSAPAANSCFTAYVSATNTVTVRFNNYSSGSIDPASATFRVAIIQF